MKTYQYDLEKIKKELETLPDYNKQLYLQGYSKDMDPEEGAGKGYDVDKVEHTYTVPLFDIPYINSIMKEHKLTRTRLMRMKPKACYLWHNDLTQRLHIPIVTNEHCFLLLDNDRIHIPATGEAYVIDTRKKHTALNCSKEDRTHIVGGLPY
jgi:hypothetical protein